MAQPYIYYIESSEKEGTYIGQSDAAGDGVKRVLQHFSGLYHYDDKGNVINSAGKAVREGTAFIDWLKSVPLNTIMVRVFTGPDFGIPKQTWIDFISQWSTSLQHKNLDGKDKAEQEAKAWAVFQALPDEAKLNMAEIIHIYNAKKQGYTLLQRQMGGQNPNLFKRGSNIVLNREASPQQMVNVIDADVGAISNMQKDFDELFRKDVLQNPKFIQKLTSDNNFLSSLIKSPDAAFRQLSKIVDDYLQSSAYGNTTVLEMLLNAVKDKSSHSAYFTISWPQTDKNAILIYKAEERAQNYRTLITIITTQLIKAIKQLDRKSTLESFSGDLEKMLNSQFNSVFVGIGSFIDLKLIVKYSGLTLFVPFGAFVDISTNLKRISYYYYAHFADMYYNQHSFQINDSKRYFDDNFDYYAKMKGETCTAFVYNRYIEQGINNQYMKNWSTWREFNQGMLSIYTKNRGNAFLSNARPDPRILMEDESNNQFVNTYAFVFHVELPFVDKEPFYEVSASTWEYVNSGSFSTIDRLTIY